MAEVPTAITRSRDEEENLRKWFDGLWSDGTGMPGCDTNFRARKSVVDVISRMAYSALRRRMIPEPTSDPASNSALSREKILGAFEALSSELGQRGVVGEVCLLGGTVMVLAFTARLTTKDVDALFQPAQPIRQIASRIAAEQHLPENWLNDGAKGFLSARHETTTGNLPQFPHLRLTMPVPEYLLAMKCMAARLGGTGDEPSDVADIRFLIRHLAFKSPAEVLDVVTLYYPANRIPVKTQYLVEGLFEEDLP
jgi:hypothetical protein